LSDSPNSPSFRSTTPPSSANIRRTVLGLAAPLDARPIGRGIGGPVDAVLAAVVVALVGFGVVMVYSASGIEATVQYHDPQFFLSRQVTYALAALAAMWLASRVDYHRLYKLTYPVLFAVGAMLVMCVAGLGHSGGGAARWLTIGPVHVQPAETAKVALVIWLAYSLAKKAERVKTFTIGFLPHLIMAGGLMLLCLKQPDFGSAVVLLLLTFTMLFVAGAKVGYILGASIVGAGLGAAAIRFREYRYERYLAWLHMDEHRQDLAYQPFQSVMSFGSGGPTGLGLGRGLQTLYLPEAHTDFVAAIVGEELGFVGVAALCLAYLLLVARGVRAALRAPDDFGAFLAFGLSTMFAVQALINLSVALALLPTKGLTLPFVSFGGSSLLVNAVAAGILLNVSRQALPASDGSRARPSAAEGHAVAAASPAAADAADANDAVSTAAPVPAIAPAQATP
jgi:cell division protein FtsW